MTLELNIEQNSISGNTTPKLIRTKGLVGGSKEAPSLKKCLKCGVKTIYGTNEGNDWICRSCEKERQERWN